MKSSRSWMVLPAPRGAMPLHTLKPSTQGMERTRIRIRFTRTDFLRVQPQRSMPKLMIFSNTAMMVDRAAKLINTKNRVPQRRPPAIWLKIFGRVTKTSPGPSPGSTPKAKQAGKITSPAISATTVSRMQMFTDSPINVRSRLI